MKLYHDYKKQFKLLFLIFLGILIIFPFVFSHGQTVGELNNKINQKNVDINKLEQEINKYQTEINNLGKKKNSLKVSLKQIDLTRKKLKANISVTKNRIDKINFKIKELNLGINNKQNIILNNKNAISLGIREINEFEQDSELITILSKNNFTVIWNDINNIVIVSKRIGEKTIELKKIKDNLENTRTETTNAKNELMVLKSKLADQKKIIDQNRRNKYRFLKQTKNNEANYQKLLKIRLVRKKAFEKELEEYESQLKFVLNPSLLPKKGVLSWPLDNIYVTQLFGVTKDSKRLYASGSHSGVDFRASVGTPVRAVADGVVIGVGNTDKTCPYASFGRFIFIQHYNGLSTTYGHLSLTKVSKNEKVKRGEIIGYSGNSGHTTGPHLHLTVYVAEAAKLEKRKSKVCSGHYYTMPIAPKNAYLDPMYYLPPYKK